jgi:UDP-N-acetylglucosamine 3-dehydrogenase
METLGAAVIGLRMGRSHALAYQKNPHTRVVGVCDLDEALLAEVARELDAPVAVTDYRELLNRDDIHVISVATPDYDHAEQSIAALRAGKHVLCEKPMAPTLEDARAMAQAAEESGCKFMIGQVCRFFPGFQKTKELIERGEIGELFFLESEYAHSYRYIRGVGNWRTDPVKLREPFLGGACHAVDLLRWIGGEMTEAFAYANRKCLTDWPVDDCTIAVYRFASGALGKVMCSIGCVRPYTMRSVFYGTEGTIISDNTSPQIQLCTQRDPAASGQFIDLPVAQPGAKPVDEEVNAFIDAIVNDAPVEMDAWQGVRTVATCLAAVESSKTGRPVPVAPPRG